jgi:hypothetical protein
MSYLQGWCMFIFYHFFLSMNFTKTAGTHIGQYSQNVHDHFFEYQRQEEEAVGQFQHFCECCIVMENYGEIKIN